MWQIDQRSKWPLAATSLAVGALAATASRLHAPQPAPAISYGQLLADTTHLQVERVDWRSDVVWATYVDGRKLRSSVAKNSTEGAVLAQALVNSAARYKLPFSRLREQIEIELAARTTERPRELALRANRVTQGKIDGFSVELANVGSRVIKVYPLAYHYSLHVLFYNALGDEPNDIAKISITLPTPMDPYLPTLGPRNSNTTFISIDGLDEEYRLDKVKYIVFEYYVSSFVRETLGPNTRALLGGPVFSNLLEL